IGETARTARKSTLDTANTSRRRFETFPISSKGTLTPRPDPGPARASEEGSYKSQAEGHDDEPDHNPPRKRSSPQELRPTPLVWGEKMSEGDKSSYNNRRHNYCPGTENDQEPMYAERHKCEHLESPNAVFCPKRLAVDIHTKIGDHDESDYHQGGNENSS